MQANIVDVKNFGNGVCYGCNGGNMMDSILSQMKRYQEHNIAPKFILMTPVQYLEVVAYSKKGVVARRHDSDENTINGLPVVICENISEPTVTTSPSELVKHGLL